MDVLSDVIRVVRLSGAVFFTGDFSAPWSLASPRPERLASLVLPEAEGMVLFHVVVEGECFVECEGHAPVALAAGDVIVFPQGDAHRMRSADGADATSIDALLPKGTPEDRLPVVTIGGGGPRSRLICGYLSCESRFGPLLSGLPTMLVVRGRDDAAAVEAITRDGRQPTSVPRGSGAWLATTLAFTIHEAEATRPGSAAMLARLTELVFVEILREYMQQLPAGRAGWLAGLKDPQVGKALRLLHGDPARAWTVEDLAREAGLSRSALAQRFTDLMGEAPMRYLANWRIQLAMHQLRDGKTVQQVAAKVGYASEAAFNRAFKRATGSPPAAWRLRTRAPARPGTVGP
jgi:AraC-like DNA-binding protein